MLFTYILIALVALVLLACVVLIYLGLEIRNKLMKPVVNDTEQIKIQLNAYERLALLAERSGLANLVSRVIPLDDSVAAAHYALTDSLKEEYNHNLAQQIYVTPEVWNAVTRLKDQHIYVINQLAGALPPGSKGADLNKRILEYTLEESTDLSRIVLDAIRFEAHKLL